MWHKLSQQLLEAHGCLSYVTSKLHLPISHPSLQDHTPTKLPLSVRKNLEIRDSQGKEILLDMIESLNLSFNFHFHFHFCTSMTNSLNIQISTSKSMREPKKATVDILIMNFRNKQQKINNTQII